MRRTRRSTPALPSASLRLAISVLFVSFPCVGCRETGAAVVATVAVGVGTVAG